MRAPVAGALHYGLLHTVHILVCVNELQNTALQALLAAHCAEVEVLQDKLQIINQHGPDQPLGRCMGGGGGEKAPKKGWRGGRPGGGGGGGGGGETESYQTCVDVCERGTYAGLRNTD